MNQPFERQKFWMYKLAQSDRLNKMETFLAQFQDELLELIDEEKNLETNFQMLCDKIGIAVHPALCNKSKERSNYPQLHNGAYGSRFIQIQNYKIDCLTLKVLSFLVSHYPITSLKFSRNEMNQESCYLNQFLQKQKSSTLLFLEWNPFLHSPDRTNIFLNTIRPNLQHLILRQNYLGNQITKLLLAQIKITPSMKLKTLDLTGNQISDQLTEEICSFIEESQDIEILGLSKNQGLNNKQFVERLFNSIGEISISEEEFNKTQSKDIEKKNTTQSENTTTTQGENTTTTQGEKTTTPQGEKRPYQFEVKQKDDGYVMVKNKSLQSLNLAKIGFGDDMTMMFKSFAQKVGANVQIFLEMNKFGRRSRNLFRMHPNLLV